MKTKRATIALEINGLVLQQFIDIQADAYNCVLSTCELQKIADQENLSLNALKLKREAAIKHASTLRTELHNIDGYDAPIPKLKLLAVPQEHLEAVREFIKMLKDESIE